MGLSLCILLGQHPVDEDPGQPVKVRLSSTYGGNDMVTKKMTPRKVE